MKSHKLHTPSLIAGAVALILVAAVALSSGQTALADEDSMTKDLHIAQMPMVIAPPQGPGSNDSSAGLSLEATVDRVDRTYQIGETVQLAVKVSEDSYLWVFDTGTSGQVHRIFPNRFDQDNFVRKGETLVVPGPDSKYDFRVSSPPGRELLTVIATTEESPLAANLLGEVTGSSPVFMPVGNAVSFAKDLSISLRNDHPVWQRAMVVLEIE